MKMQQSLMEEADDDKSIETTQSITNDEDKDPKSLRDQFKNLTSSNWKCLHS
jgi:transcriptional accessory protein Tex/SPT6